METKTDMAGTNINKYLHSTNVGSENLEMFSFYERPIEKTSEHQHRISQYTPPTKSISIQELHGLILGSKYKAITERLRSQLKTSKKAYDIDKVKQLHSVIPSGEFSGFLDDKLIKHSNLFCVDIDGISQGDKEHITKQLSLSYVLLFTSPSGKGLKIIFRIDTNKHSHLDWYFAFERYFKRKFNVNIDTKCKNVSRLCFLCHDPQVIYAPSAPVVNFDLLPSAEQTRQEAQPQQAQPPKQQANNSSGESDLIKVIINMIKEAPDGDKHGTLLEASRILGHYISGENFNEAHAIELLETEIKKKDIADFEGAQRTIRDGIKYGKNRPKKYALKNIPLYGLPQEIQDILNHYQSVFNTPIDLWAGAMFGALATAIGNGARVKTKYENSPLFWFLTVAPSGTGKTQPHTEYLKPFHYRDGKEIERFKREVDKYMKYKKLPKAERDEMEEETPPEAPRQFIVSDTTPEALMRANQNNPCGISLHRDEFNGFLKDIGRYNKSGEIEQLLSIWSGNPTTINRSTKSSDVDSGITHILEPYINIFGGIQDGLLSEIQKNGMDESGFMARFLYVYPDQFDKPTYNRKEVDEAIKRQYVSIIDKLIMFRENNEQTVYTLSHEAETIYEAFFNYNATLINKANQTNNNSFATLYSKLDVYALRFALLFHCVEYACTTDPQIKRLKEISGAHMKYAIDVCEYFRRTGEKVMNRISADKLPLQNKMLAMALHEKGNSQQQIADVLKISQPAVNKLLKPKQ
jgi:hypothetical protein